MIFDQWAARWGVPYQAIAELKQLIGCQWAENTQVHVSGQSGSEGRQSSIVRLDAAAHDVLLFRNNVGAFVHPETGRAVRYGLANDSKQMNEQYKSADLIGVRRVRIARHMVGMDIGQFVGREVKKEFWSYSGDDHEQAQARWAELMNSYGADCRFTTGKGSFD